MAENFENYLRYVHGLQYTGTDDDMSEDFDEWLINLEAHEFIIYADECANELLEEQQDHLTKCNGK